MEQTTKIGLAYLLPQQAQKHVTVNEGLRRLDALVLMAAKSASLAAQPGAPGDGDLYLLPAGKTGAAWGAYANYAIGYYVDGAWSQISPRAGWRAFVEDENAFRYYDGASWKHEGAAAAASVNQNVLINPDFAVNQRVFAGGALGAGVYGFDRWKAGGGGASLSRAGGVVTLSAGSIEQIVEPALFARASFASATMTVKAHGLAGGALSVTVGAGAAIVLTAAAPAATLTVPAAATGTLAVAVAVSSGTPTFTALKLEEGAVATAHLPRLAAAELQLCQRYYCKSLAMATAPTDGAAANTQWGGSSAADTASATTGNIYFPVPMRATPTIAFYRLSLGTQNGKWNYVKNGAWQDNVTATSAVGATERQFRVRIEASSGPFTAHLSYPTGGDWTASAEY